MPEDDGYLPFALATLGICIPTYLIIVVVNNPDKVRFLVNSVELLIAYLLSCAIPKQHVEKIKRKIEHQREKQQDSQPGHTQRRPFIRKTATHASFEARLSADMALDPIRHASQSIVNGTRRMSQTLSHHLPGTGRGAGRRFLNLAPKSHKMPIVTEADLVPQMSANSLEPPSTPPLAAFGRYARTSTIPIDDLTFSSPRRSQTRSSTVTNPNTSPTDLYPEGIIARDMERSSTLSPTSLLSPGTTPPPPFGGPTQSNQANGSIRSHEVTGTRPNLEIPVPSVAAAAAIHVLSPSPSPSDTGQGAISWTTTSPVAATQHAPSPNHLPVVDRSLLRRWTDRYSPLERSARGSRVNTPETPSPREQV